MTALARVAPWLVVLVSGAALFPLQGALDARRPKTKDSLLYLPDKRLLKVLACGHGSTAADLAWIRATGYAIEEFRQAGAEIRYLYELFDAMTELDPDFVDGYEGGAILLACLTQRPERAERLLEKGEGALVDDGKLVAADPAGPQGRVHKDHLQRWRLAFSRASLHLVTFAGLAETGDERELEIRRAGRLYVYTAERYANADPSGNLRQLGERLRERRLPAAMRARWELAVWNEQLATGNEAIREVARKRADEARCELGRIAIEEAIIAFVRQNRRLPGRLEDLATPDKRYGLEKLPDDPLGVGYRLEGTAVRARGHEAARLGLRLERKVQAFLAEKGRRPKTLDEVGGLGAAPVDLAVTYDAETGRVRVVPR